MTKKPVYYNVVYKVINIRYNSKKMIMNSYWFTVSGIQWWSRDGYFRVLSLSFSLKCDLRNKAFVNATYTCEAEGFCKINDLETILYLGFGFIFANCGCSDCVIGLLLSSWFCFYFRLFNELVSVVFMDVLFVWSSNWLLQWGFCVLAILFAIVSEFVCWCLLLLWIFVIMGFVLNGLFMVWWMSFGNFNPF